MKFCPSCSAVMKDDETVCAKCGEAASDASSATVQPTNTQSQFAAPQQPQFAAPQQPQFAAPQQPQYGAPQQPQFGAPQQPQFGAPQQPQYGAPQQPQYGAPQQPQYGAPQYGAPQQPPFGAPWYGQPRRSPFASMPGIMSNPMNVMSLISFLYAIFAIGMGLFVFLSFADVDISTYYSVSVNPDDEYLVAALIFGIAMFLTAIVETAFGALKKLGLGKILPGAAKMLAALVASITFMAWL